MKIKINGRELEVNDNDEITVEQEPCDICGKHTNIYQERDGKVIWKEENPY